MVAMRESEYNVTLDLATRFLKAAQHGAIDRFCRVVKRGHAAGLVEEELRDAQGVPPVRGHATTRIQAGFPKRV